MRLGIIGYGKMGRFHRQVFEAQGCEVVGSVNRSEAGRARADADGVPKTFDDVDRMVDALAPDALICCAAFTDIAEVCSRLAGRGMPLLIEKPPGLSLAEFEGLSQRIEDTRTPHVVGLNRRHYSVHRKAVEALGGREALTAIRLEWSEMPQAFLDRGYSLEAVHRLAIANSLHGLDALSWWGGDSAPPDCEGRCLGGDTFRRQMELRTIGQWGATISFRSTWDAPAGWRLVFEAEGASVVCAPMEEATLYRPGVAAESLAPDASDIDYKAGMFGQAAAFIQVVNEGVLDHPFNLSSCRQSMAWAEVLTRLFRQPESEEK